jgi:hypothetical protein
VDKRDKQKSTKLKKTDKPEGTALSKLLGKLRGTVFEMVCEVFDSESETFLVSHVEPERCLLVEEAGWRVHVPNLWRD